MKRFLFQLSTFLVLFAAVDFCMGKLLQYGESHATGGDTERVYYINNKSHEEMLIFGSSRSTNHITRDFLKTPSTCLYIIVVRIKQALSVFTLS